MLLLLSCSVDTDLLCYFAKELLELHRHLKLVLMSATLCVDQYREYFAVNEDGACRGWTRLCCKAISLCRAQF